MNNKDTRVTPGPYHIETSPLVCRANMFKINNEGTRMPSGPYHIKTSPRIYRANQWAEFYMVATWRHSVVFTANFEHILHLVLVFLTLSVFNFYHVIANWVAKMVFSIYLYISCGVLI